MHRGLVYFSLFCSLADVTWSAKVDTKHLMINFARDNVVDMFRMLNKTDPIRETSRSSAGYEVGFILRNMEECYRRMVDIYNSSLTTDLYNWDAQTTDHIIFLKEIEMLHWVIDNLANMLHETEKKYKIKTAGMFENDEGIDLSYHTTAPPKRSRTTPVEKFTRSRRRRTSQRWWPIDYGWEVNYDWG